MSKCDLTNLEGIKEALKNIDTLSAKQVEDTVDALDKLSDGDILLLGDTVSTVGKLTSAETITLKALQNKLLSSESEQDAAKVLNKIELLTFIRLQTKENNNVSSDSIALDLKNFVKAPLVDMEARLEERLASLPDSDAKSKAEIGKMLGAIRTAKERLRVTVDPDEQENLRIELAIAQKTVEVLLSLNHTQDAEWSKLNKQILEDMKQLAILSARIKAQKGKTGASGNRKKLQKQAADIKERLNLNRAKRVAREKVLDGDKDSTLVKLINKESAKIRKGTAKLKTVSVRSPDLSIQMMANKLKNLSPEDVKRAVIQTNHEINLVETVVEDMLNRDNELSVLDATKLFGRSEVLEHMESKDQVKWDRAKTEFVLATWSTKKRMSSVYDSKNIADTDFTNKQTLEETRAWLLSDGNIFDHTVDTIHVPSKTETDARTEAAEKGWVNGEVPNENKVSNGAEMAEIVLQAISMVKTLQGLEGMRGLMTAAHLRKLFENTKLSDVSETFFEDAIVVYGEGIDKPTNNMEYKLIAQHVFLQLGLSEAQITAMPEMSDANWNDPSTPKEIRSIDIETSRNESNREIFIAGVSNTKAGEPLSQRHVYRESGEVWSPEYARQFLVDLEAQQNAGSRLVWHNGVNFDIRVIKDVALRAQGLTEAEILAVEQLAMRVMLRSFDTMENVRSVSKRRVTLDNLADAAQSHLSPEDRVKKIKETSGTDIETLWGQAFNEESPDAGSLATVLEYLDGDINTTQAVVDGILYRSQNGLATDVVFNVGDTTESVNLSVIPLKQNLMVALTRAAAAPRSFMSGYVSGNMDPTMNIIQDGSLSGFNNTSDFMFDAKKVEASLNKMLYTSLMIDADSSVLVSDLIKTSKGLLANGVTRRLQIATAIASENMAGMREINKEMYLENDGALILDYNSDGSPVLVASRNKTDNDQWNEWSEKYTESFLEAINDKYINNTEELASAVDFRKQNKGESLQSYIIELSNHVINIALPEAKNGLVDIANGNLDYAPAVRVGYGMVQIILGDDGVSGVRHKYRKDKLIPLEEQKQVNTKEEFDEVRQELTMERPDRTRVSWFSPLGLAQVNAFYDDYRLRQRITHILNKELTDAEVQGLFERIKNETITPDDANILKRTKIGKFGRVPFVNQRRIYSVMPDIDVLRQQSLEAMFEIPTVLVAFNHDAWWYGSEFRLLNEGDDAEANSYPLTAKALNPGLPTGSVLLNGIAPVLAWAATYPAIQGDKFKLIHDALKRGHANKGARKAASTPLHGINHIDGSNNGMHHMAALLLQYAPESQGRSLLMRINNELGIDLVNFADPNNDLYNNIVNDALLSMQQLKDKMDNNRLLGLTQEERHAINSAIDVLSSEEGRDWLKGAIVPRIYGSGAVGIATGLENKSSKLIENPFQESDYGQIAEILVNSKSKRSLRDANKVTTILSEALFQATTLSELNILDKNIGITSKQRQELATWMANSLDQHINGNDIGFLTEQRLSENLSFAEKSSAKTMLNLHTSANIRIKKMAEAMTPNFEAEGGSTASREVRIKKNEKMLRGRYNKRFEKAAEYLESIGGKPTTDEHHLILNVIMSGDAEFKVDLETGKKVIVNTSHKVNQRLAGLNALNRVPREIMSTAIDNAINMQGYGVEINDMMGLVGKNIYASTWWDLAGGRVYQGDVRSQTHQDVKLQSFYDADENPDGMFKFGNLLELPDGKAYDTATNEEISAYVDRLVAQEIMLRLAEEYTPEIGSYDAATESRENFFRAFKERSQTETDSYVDRLLDEMDIDASTSAKREKAGGLLQSHTRRILDRTLDARNNSQANKDYDRGSTLKGPASFRPMYAGSVFDEVGSTSMSLLATRLEERRIVSGHLGNVDSSTDPNEIIPPRHRGSISRFNPKDVPYIPQSSVTATRQIMYDHNNDRIENKLIYWTNELNNFAQEVGLQHLVEEGNWVRLKGLYAAERFGIEPYLNDVSNITETTASESEFETAKFNYLSNLFDMIVFQYDATSTEYNVIELGEQMGFNPDDMSKNNVTTYLSLLKYMRKKGIKKLDSLDFGLTFTANVYTPDSPRRLGSRPDQDISRDATTTVPVTVQGMEVVGVLRVALDTVEGMRQLTNMVNQNKLDIKGTTVAGKKRYVNHTDVAQYDLENGTDWSMKFIDIFTQSDFFMNRVADSMGLYVNIDNEGNAKYKLAMSDSGNLEHNPATKPMQNLGLDPILRTRSWDPDTRIVFTADHLNKMMSALRNAPVFSRAEDAKLANAELGMTRSATHELQDLKQQQFYEAQRHNLSDEFEILWSLHQRSGNTDLRLFENTELSDNMGLPLQYFDSQFHFTQEIDSQSNLTVAQEMFTMPIRRAINKLENRSSPLFQRPEIATLNELLAYTKSGAKDSITLVKAVVLLSRIDGNVERKAEALRSFLGENVDVVAIQNMAAKYVTALQTAVTKPKEMGNPFYFSAHAALEKFAPDIRNKYDLAEAMENKMVMEFMNVKSSEDFILAQRALVSADRAPSLMDDYALTPAIHGLDVVSFMNEDAFANTFGDDGERINHQIANLVSNNLIDTETANFYRGLIGTILRMNPDALSDLSFDISDSLDRSGSSQKLNGLYSIEFGKSLAGRAAGDKIRVLAHELVHIARLKYISHDSVEWNGLKAIFSQKGRGEAAMRKMLGIMRDGMDAGFNAELEYYMSNPDEFLAEWGAYLLISETFRGEGKGKTVMDQIEAKDPDVSKITTMWGRAFRTIKRMFTGIMVNFDLMKKVDTELYDMMYNMMDGMFNLTASSDFAAMRDANNADSGPMGVRKDISIDPLKGIGDAESNLTVAKELYELSNRHGSFSPEERSRFNSLRGSTTGKAMHTRSKITGLLEYQYLYIIDQLQAGEESVEWHQKLGPLEKKAVLERVVRDAANARGIRIDDKTTLAGVSRHALAAVEKIFMAGTIQKRGSSFNNAENKTILENVIEGFAIDGLLGSTGIVDSQIRQTWNSFVPMLAALSFVLDNTSATTDGSFTQSEGLASFTAGKTNLRLVEQQVESASANVNRVNGIQRGPMINVAARAYLYDPNTPVLNSLTLKEQESAKQLATVYQRAMRQVIQFSIDNDIRSLNSSDFDPTFLGLVTNRTLTGSKKSEDQVKVREALDALVILQANKLEGTLRQDGMPALPILYASGFMPVVDFADNVSNRSYTNNADVIQAMERLRDGSTGDESGSTEGRRIMFKLIDSVARKLWMKESGITTTETWNLAGESITMGINKAPYYRAALKELNLQMSKQKNTWQQVAADNGITNVELNVLFNELKAYVNPAEGSIEQQGSERRLSDADTMRLLDFSRTGKRPGKRTDQLSPTPTAAGWYISNLRDSMGYTAYVGTLNDVSLNSKDIYGGETTPLHESARNYFTSDLRLISRGITRSIGMQAASRAVIHNLTGVRGLDFMGLLTQLETTINSVEHLNASGDALDTKLRKKMLEGINVLRRKHEVIAGVAQRYEPGTPLGDKAIDILGGASAIAWRRNLNLAALTSEFTSSLMVAFLKRTGGTKFLVNMLYNTFDNLRVLTRPLSQADARGAMRGAVNTLLETQTSARTESIEGDIVADEGNKRRGTPSFSGVNRWMQRASNVANQSIKQATIQNAIDHLIKKEPQLRRVVEDIQSLSDTPDRKTVKRLLKKHKINVDVDVFRNMMQANVFGDNNLRIAGILFHKAGRAAFAPDTFGAIETIMQLSEEADADGRVDLGDGVFATTQDMLRAMTTVIQFSENQSNMSVVTTKPMDAPTKDHAVNWLMSIYRTFPLLFATQMVFRDSARVGMPFFFARSMTWMISDIIYNVLLSVLGGYMTFEKLDEMRDNPEEAMEFFIQMAVRNPILGRGGSEAAQLAWAILLSDNKWNDMSRAVGVQPLGAPAIQQTAKNVSGGLMALLSGDPKTAYRNLSKYLEPLGDSASVLLLSLLFPEQRDWFINQQNISRMSGGKKTNPVTVAKHELSQDPALSNQAERQMLLEIMPWLKERESNQSQRSDLPTPPNFTKEQLKALKQIQDETREPTRATEAPEAPVTPPKETSASPPPPAPEAPTDAPSAPATKGDSLDARATTPAPAPNSLKPNTEGI